MVKYAGLSGNLYQVPAKSLEPIIASPDFYIRKSLDLKHVQDLVKVIQEGEELPPVIVATIKELSAKRIINGNHTAKAYAMLDREVSVLDLGELSWEEAVKLQAELNHQGKVLTLKPEDLKHYAELLYMAFRSELGGKKDRRTAVQRIALYLRKSERWIYHYLEEVIQKEDEELKKRAFELVEKGLSQEEIAKALGIDQATVSRWLSKELQNTLTKLDNKPLKLCIFEVTSKMHNLSLSHSTLMAYNLNRDFVKLLDEYYSVEGRRFAGIPEWLKEKGYEIDQKEWEELVRLVVGTLERTLIANLGKTDKEIRLAMEKELSQLGKTARERIVLGFLEHMKGKVEKDYRTAQRILDELDTPEVVDVRSEFLKRLRKEEGLLKKHAELWASLFSERLEELEKKYPVLKEEDIDSLPEVDSKEELLQELKAQYYDYRIPQELVDRLWTKLSTEKKQKLLEELSRIDSLEDLEEWAMGVDTSLIEKELEQKRKALLKAYEDRKVAEFIGMIRGLSYGSFTEFVESLSEEDKAIALRRVKELREVFDKLPKASEERIRELLESGLTGEEVLESLRSEGYLPEKERVLKVKERLLREEEEKLRQKEEELRKKEEERQVIEGKLMEGDDELPEWVKELIKEEDTESVRTIGFKGLVQALEKAIEELQKQKLSWQKAKELFEKTQNKEGIKLSEKSLKDLERLIQSLQNKLEKAQLALQKKEEKKKASPVAVKYAYKAFQEWLSEYRSHTGMDLPERDKSRGLAEFSRLFDEYLQKGMDMEEFYEVFISAMRVQFSRLLNTRQPQSIAWLTPSDLVMNFARYIPIANYDKFIAEHTRRTAELIENMLNGEFEP